MARMIVIIINSPKVKTLVFCWVHPELSLTKYPPHFLVANLLPMFVDCTTIHHHICSLNQFGWFKLDFGVPDFQIKPFICTATPQKKIGPSKIPLKQCWFPPYLGRLVLMKCFLVYGNYLFFCIPIAFPLPTFWVNYKDEKTRTKTLEIIAKSSNISGDVLSLASLIIQSTFCCKPNLKKKTSHKNQPFRGIPGIASLSIL